MTTTPALILRRADLAALMDLAAYRDANAGTPVSLDA
jgi:hypothetical protein